MIQSYLIYEIAMQLQELRRVAIKGELATSTIPGYRDERPVVINANRRLTSSGERREGEVVRAGDPVRARGDRVVYLE
jgi:hypothetical protein